MVQALPSCYRAIRQYRALLLLIAALAVYSLVNRPYLQDTRPTIVNSQISHNSNHQIAKAIPKLLPEIVWLASYPNSGTSYTMTLVERASNLSTASHYGDEVTFTNDTSVLVHAGYPEGPYWEGVHGRMQRKIRLLPTNFVLTKTHCGGRCIHCGASDYAVNISTFLDECLRTSGRFRGKKIVSSIKPDRVSRVVHLIRNPFHNIVARYHLDRRHFVKKNPELDSAFPFNATGFQRWCKELDDLYKEEEYVLDETTQRLMKPVPCRGEFYKFVKWHEHALNMIPLLNPNHVIPSMILHYEDYHYNFNVTATRIFEFVEQSVVDELRPFRSLPTYEDHFFAEQMQPIQELMEHLASPRLWSMLRRYVESVSA